MKLRARLVLISFLALLVPVLATIALAAAAVVEASSQSQEKYFRATLDRIKREVADTEGHYRRSVEKLASSDFLLTRLHVYDTYWNYISPDTRVNDIEVLRSELESYLLTERIDAVAVYRTDFDHYQSVSHVGNATYLPETVYEKPKTRTTAFTKYVQIADGVYASFYQPVLQGGKEIGLVVEQKAYDRNFFETLSLRYNTGIALYAQGLYRYSSLPGIETAGVLTQRTPTEGNAFTGEYHHGATSYRYVGQFFEMDSEAKGFLFVGGPATNAAVLWASTFGRLAILPLISVALATLGFFFWGRELIRHIRELLVASEKIGRGEYDVSLSNQRSDELGELFQGFTRMAEQLHQNALRLEENKRQLITTEKMAAVGEFSAGVAHEINNPLGVILNHVQLLRSGRLSAVEQEEFLARIEAEIKRVNRLLQGLLHYASNDDLVFREFQPIDVVYDVVQLFAPKLRLNGVEVQVESFPPDFVVEGDVDAIKQVLFNLLYNSLQAIRHDHGQIVIGAAAANGGFDLRVSDNGPGMDPATVERVFEPYFTSKKGYGTGLGLSLSRKIMKRHGGDMMVESVENVGTSVVLHFPRREDLE